MIVEAGLGRAVVGAEAQHDADLVGLDAIEPARQPDHEDRDEDDRDPGAGAEPARQDAAEPALAAPQQFLEIGGLGPRLRGPDPPPLLRGPPPHGPPPRGPPPHGPPP